MWARDTCIANSPNLFTNMLLLLLVVSELSCFLLYLSYVLSAGGPPSHRWTQKTNVQPAMSARRNDEKLSMYVHGRCHRLSARNQIVVAKHCVCIGHMTCAHTLFFALRRNSGAKQMFRLFGCQTYISSFMVIFCAYHGCGHLGWFVVASWRDRENLKNHQAHPKRIKLFLC